jgi:hypothetical protein
MVMAPLFTEVRDHRLTGRWGFEERFMGPPWRRERVFVLTVEEALDRVMEGGLP